MNEAVTSDPQEIDFLASQIEALLLITDRPLSAQALHRMLCPAAAPLSAEESASAEAELVPSEESPALLLEAVQQAIESLQSRYQSPHHGIELAEIAGGYQLRTKLIHGPLLKKLSKVQVQRLSSGALETLAIIAYRQPLLKEDIDQVRGVDSAYFLRTLLERKLIEISGRSELPGRPLLYCTTPRFLEVFGLNDLGALPSLREIEEMAPASEVGPKDFEDTPEALRMREALGHSAQDSNAVSYDPAEDEAILQELRSRIQSIPLTTPYLMSLKAAEEAAALAEQNPEANSPSETLPFMDPEKTENGIRENPENPL